MNFVNAKYQSKVFADQSNFEFDVDKCNIFLCVQSNNLEIRIKGRKGSEKLEAVLAEIESLLFVYLGSFPAILSLSINGVEQDLTDRINKYKTSSRFVKKNLALCSISPETVNSDVINVMRTIKRTPMFSLQYIVSESYDCVIQDHKITLLLHIVEGVVDKGIIKKELAEAIRKYSISSSDLPGEYFGAAYYICKHYFFNFHKKYNCGILQLLAKNQRSFLQTITDTRNWYSHLFYESKKPDRLKNGKEMMIYFEIIYYTLRLMLIDKLGLKPNEDCIKEFYNSVHDWIAELYKKNVPLKSIAYTNREMINNIIVSMKVQDYGVQKE